MPVSRHGVRINLAHLMSYARLAARRSALGFTLVELMVVVAIIGILFGVALPNYKDYVRRGSLSEATSALSDYRIKMEQYYQDNRNYGGAACADGASAPAWNTFKPGGRKNFSYECKPVDGQAYTITATGEAGTPAAGHVFTLSSDAASPFATRTFKGVDVADKPCWLLKGDEC